MNDPDPYTDVEVAGVILDPYRVADLFGVTDPAVFQALKKLLRMGLKHKDRITDAKEVISSMQRYIAMLEENEARPDIKRLDRM